VLDSVRISPIAEAMVAAGRRRVSRVVQPDFPRRLKWLAAIFAEFQQAIAAARRYEELKLHGSVVRRHDIPNRIFEEFYSHIPEEDESCSIPWRAAAGKIRANDESRRQR
jgi:hypothetical protein